MKNDSEEGLVGGASAPVPSAAANSIGPRLSIESAASSASLPSSVNSLGSSPPLSSISTILGSRLRLAADSNMSATSASTSSVGGGHGHGNASSKNKERSTSNLSGGGNISFAADSTLPDSIPEEAGDEDAPLNNLDRLLAWHPSYLESELSLRTFIMKEEGPLPRDWRLFISIIAVCRHSCEYLYRRQRSLFLRCGGDRAWLTMESIPPKLRSLFELNALLAHRPWLVTADDMRSLVKGDDAWSITELVHAVVIMCQYHALCGFAFGLGVVYDLDDEEEEDFGAVGGAAGDADNDDQEESGEEEEEGHEDGADEESIRARLRENLDTLLESSGLTTSPRDVFNEATAKVAVARRRRRAEAGLGRFWGGVALNHKDFDVKSTEYSVFRVSDYNWDDQGYALLSRFFPGCAPLLDNQFKLIYHLTYNKFGDDEDVDTGPYRTAVWYYVQRIYGILHDDYEYRYVNIFLNRAIKTYIKKVTCYPETIALRDFEIFSRILKNQEKAHVVLLAIESRKQASLLYALGAIAAQMKR